MGNSFERMENIQFVAGRVLQIEKSELLEIPQGACQIPSTVAMSL